MDRNGNVAIFNHIAEHPKKVIGSIGTELDELRSLSQRSFARSRKSVESRVRQRSVHRLAEFDLHSTASDNRDRVNRWANANSTSLIGHNTRSRQSVSRGIGDITDGYRDVSSKKHFAIEPSELVRVGTNGRNCIKNWSQRPLAHQLKHGSEAGVLRTLEDLIELAQGLDEEKAETVRREVNYFQSHREHLHYKNVKAQNCPIGSGAMESGCAQLQERFKSPGKFWSEPGHARLMALETARRNDDWAPLV
jgi:hypothetical protein